MPFTIYFHGLMCFIGDERDTEGLRKTHVAIIDEKGHHTPGLTVPGHPPRKLEETDEITFSLGEAAASTTPLFRASVPHLKVITAGGVLHQPIRDRAEHREVVAYVVLPGGTLDVHDMYDEKGQYKLNGSNLGGPTCVARITKLEVETDASITITVTDKSPSNPRQPITYTVPAASFICIGNVTRVVSQHASHDRHLAHHRPLTSGTTVAEVDSISNDPCGERDNSDPCNFKLLDGANPECSNSQYP
jgi:hypothetical protein